MCEVTSILLQDNTLYSVDIEEKKCSCWEVFLRSRIRLILLDILVERINREENTDKTFSFQFTNRESTISQQKT